MGKKKQSVEPKAYAAAHRQRLGQRAHDSGVQRLKALETLLQRKEAACGAASDEGLRYRLQLAEACIAAFDWEKAAALLSRALELDPSDALYARRRLAPLLLRLGRHADVTALLAKWRDDESAAMRCAALLAGLASGPDEAATTRDFAALCLANWRLAVLLAGWRTAWMLPDGARDELCDLKRATPVAGGVEEALLLASREFAGWAGDPDGGDSDDEEGADGGGGASGRGGGEEEGRGWPGLQGMAASVGLLLLQHPPPASDAAPAEDRKKFVAIFHGAGGASTGVAADGGMLARSLEEVQRRVQATEDDDDDEEEDGEEEDGEDGEEEEDDDEDDDSEEEGVEESAEEGGEEGEEGADADGGLRVEEAADVQPPKPKRNRAAFEAWLAEKRGTLKAKRARAEARAAPGEAVVVSDEESDDAADSGSE